jgi:hypothetical protein
MWVGAFRGVFSPEVFMNSDIKKRLTAIEKRLSVLEEGHGLNGEEANTIIKMELVFPEADINGLHFNATGVSAVFEKQDDGWYHSRDILFLSARNVEDDNSYDTLTKYLNCYDFKTSIRQQLPEEIFGEVMTPDKIEVSLPTENEGIKKYNGVSCWYWLYPRSSKFAAAFCNVLNSGTAYANSATGVGGCAPAFRVT